MSSETVELRLATPDDLLAIQAVLVQTWHHLYEHLERGSKLSTRYHLPARLREELDDPTQQLVVAVLDGEIVATATGGERDDGTYLIERVYVRPTMQGRGLGARLLTKLLDYAGPKRARVELDPRNRRAIGFYVEHGFSIVGQLEDIDDVLPHAGYLVMEREA